MRPSDRIARKSANEFAMKIHRPEDLTLVQTRSRGHRLRRPHRRRLATPRRSFAFHFTKAQNNASNSCLKLKGKVAAFTSAYAMPPVSTRRWTHVCIRTHMRKRACVRAQIRYCVLARAFVHAHVRTREYVIRRRVQCTRWQYVVSQPIHTHFSSYVQTADENKTQEKVETLSN